MAIEDLTGQQIGIILRRLRPGAEFQVRAYPHRTDGDVISWEIVWTDTVLSKPTDQEIEDDWSDYLVEREQERIDRQQRRIRMRTALQELKALDLENIDITAAQLKRVLKNLILIRRGGD
jgi:hypothetical protein